MPGSGHRDTVPHTLDAGAFVLRTAAVRKYGGAALQRLVKGVGRFADGGLATYGDDGERAKPKKNREAVKALKTIDLGLQGMEAYLGWVQRNFTGTMTFASAWQAKANQARQAEADRLSDVETELRPVRLAMTSLTEAPGCLLVPWERPDSPPGVPGRPLGALISGIVTVTAVDSSMAADDLV